MCGSPSQTTKSSSTFTPTAEASGLYSNVINQATAAAATPYNPATQQQVAGFNADQTDAFGAVGDAQGAWSPYMDTASQFATQAAGPISGSQIQQYMDPYQQQVIDATMEQMNRQNAIEQARLKGNAVSTGALGGNAPAVSAAMLAGEQGRNRNSTIANLLSGGYGQALSAAQQDAARQQAAASQFAQFGQNVQGMTYNDIQAQLAAGNQQQQQQQNVFNAQTQNAQAETMWPYQNAQWLASIGQAVGPLTGGTTSGTGTTTQNKGTGQMIGQIAGAGLSAASMMSDRRTKEDVSRVGFSDDGQPIYKFRYRGSPKTQIGFMADEVEKSHPEAVGTGPYGLKTVDYDKATNFADGGSAFGGGSNGFFPWASLTPSQQVQPQLPSAPGMATPEASPFDDPAKAMELGKSARGGIEDLYRSIDPAGGWGASIEPTAAAGAGKGIGSLFGFARGGAVPDDIGGIGDAPIGLADLIMANAPANGFESDASGIYDSFRPAPQLSFEGANEVVNPDPNTPSLQIGHRGFAQGGAAFGPNMLNMDEPRSIRQLIPEGAPIISPYGTQPGDEYIGEVGPSGVEDIGEVGPPPAAPEVPWYRQSLTDMLGITEGRTDPSAGLTLPTPPAKPRDPLVPNAPQVQNPEPSPWSMDNGVIRYGGKSLADYLSGRDPNQMTTTVEDAPNDPFGSPEMLYGDTEAPGASLTPTTRPGTHMMPDGSVMADSAMAAPADTGIPSTLDFIKQQEGYTPVSKWDKRQYSVGYGTRGEPGERIDKAEAERRLRAETGRVESWLDENVTVPLAPGQRTGLVSFGYNLGTDDLDRLKDDINAGNWGRVAARMKSFNKAKNDETGELEVLQGLTDRRIREAALVSGGASLPEGVADLPPAMGETAAKGYASADVGGKKYRGKEDRQVGGLIKRMFGVNFNPLNLEEDERMAMLVAGLSMMSDGDIGKGGLAGVNYLKNKSAADKNTAIEMAKLALAERKIDGDLLASQFKPTTDQREFAQAKSEGFQGTLLDFMKEKQKASGGAKVASEVAGRVGLGRSFQANVPSIKDRIRKLTPADRVDLQLGRGDAANLYRDIESGKESLIRMLTGAAMPEQEATRYAARYSIQVTDTQETMLRKIDALARDIQAAEAGIIQGATGELAEGYSGPRPQAKNAAGDVLEFNGSAWVPVSQTGMR